MTRYSLPLLVGITLGLHGCGAYSLASAPEGANGSGASSQPGSKSRGAKAGTRPAVFAGSEYPAERALIVAESQRLLRAVSTAPTLPGKPLVLVVPHARWSQSGEAMMAAFRTIGPDDFKRVVLVGPAHEPKFDGFSLSNVGAYQTPMGDVPLCDEAGKLGDGEPFRNVPDSERLEQSLEIELPLLQARLSSFCLVPILVGKTDQAQEKKLADKLSKLHDGKTLFVFSTDLIHYGPRYTYTPLGPSAAKVRDQIASLEKRALSLLQNRDGNGFRKFIDSTGATLCGWHGLSVMLELLGRIAPQAQSVLLAHYGSSDVGDAKDENRVGYASLAYLEKDPAPNPPVKAMGAPPRPKAPTADASPLSSEQGEQLLRIAQATLNTELKKTRDLATELAALTAPGPLDRLQAVQVVLLKGTEVRGGMGQTEPEFRLPEAVIRATLDAALHDPRFKPVKPEELDKLTVEVALLSRPRAINNWRDINLGTDGILLEQEQKRALFLPREPTSQRWTLVRTLTELSKKAGLSSKAWRAADAKFSVFTAQDFRVEPKAAPPPPAAPPAASAPPPPPAEFSGEILRDATFE